jgi:hypothetical protein
MKYYKDLFNSWIAVFVELNREKDRGILIGSPKEYKNPYKNVVTLKCNWLAREFLSWVRKG